MDHKADISRSLITATMLLFGGTVLAACAGWYFLTYLPRELSLAMQLTFWAGAGAISLLSRN